MNDILEWLVTAENTRRQAKVKHLMRDIINRHCVFRRGCKRKRTDSIKVKKTLAKKCFFNFYTIYTK
jgi:hypothetical protein